MVIELEQGLSEKLLPSLVLSAGRDIDLEWRHYREGKAYGLIGSGELLFFSIAPDLGDAATLLIDTSGSTPNGSTLTSNGSWGTVAITKADTESLAGTYTYSFDRLS